MIPSIGLPLILLGWQAYDWTQPLSDPPLPEQPPPLDFAIELDTAGSPNASQEQLGTFLGMSLEMSLAEAIIGPNKTWLRPQFLNLMSTVKERGGVPVLRLGGNTQEKAEMVDDLPNYAAIHKFSHGPSGYTNTPTVFYKLSIIEAMRATSDLLGIKWFLGIPMNQTNPPRLDIIEKGEPILGDYLWGWQLGNEPDLYKDHKYRSPEYSPEDYILEYESVITALRNNPKIKNPNKLGGPGVCCDANWSTQRLIDEFKYLDRVGDALNCVIIEHYPTDNCPVDPGRPTPQQAITGAMNHQYAVNFANIYDSVVQSAKKYNKPIILLETNTGSCNGFLGYSDAFASALWAVDLAMTLASRDWTHMMLHLGGQQAYYNPFVPPPHNASAPFMWTVGPPMYAILAVAEALGPTGKARVAEITQDDKPLDNLTPGYVIYENNQPARLLLINYMSDPTGAHDYMARIAWNGAQVRTRMLYAEHVTTKIPNVTWAGQSFGGYFESDGLLRGEQVTELISCSGGVCPIRVPGPSAMLVFLTDAAYHADDDMKTFATSHTTKARNTAAVDGLTLATSNGIDARMRAKMWGTSTSGYKSKLGISSARTNRVPMSLVLAFALLLLF
ncbi:hypothetical protein AURDEDRAFT_163225 [Auricularia subglabra TFB-10046 SS5]|nr:hypothetical protein AURDEDRAFT_163225 [Auricularia subglabra TFB-10046 SS5]